MINSPPVAVVAGVGPGLGAAVCRTLADADYRVAALARTTNYTSQLAEEMASAGQQLLALPCDVTDTKAVSEAFQYVDAQLGPADVLVYNAGQLVVAPFLEIAAETFEQAWRVTCGGAMACAQQAIARMQSQQAGTLIFTGATASRRGGAGFAAFAAAKFALRGMVQSLAREFGPQGIHVAHVLIDGQIQGEAAQQRGAEPTQCLEPQAIAQAYLDLIRQHRSAWTQELDLRPDMEQF